MHKLTVLTTVIFGIVIVFSANAATKCVELKASSPCMGTPTAGKIQWSLSCNDVPLKGIGVCVSTEGNDGDTLENLDTVDAADANTHCWCQMTSPALSRFVFRGTYVSASSCSQACPYQCTSSVLYVAAFRALLFSNLQ